MSKGNSFLLNVIFFLFGVLVCYIVAQYRYLKIDPEVNVVNTILGLLTAIIGLYIAISIQKKFNRSQGLHNYVQSKFDATWTGFNQLTSQLIPNPTIPLGEATKAMKQLFQELEVLKRIFFAFNLKQSCLEDCEREIETLNELLTDELPINNNLIDLNPSKSKVQSITQSVNQKFAETLVEINRIL